VRYNELEKMKQDSYLNAVAGQIPPKYAYLGALDKEAYLR